MSLKLRSSDWNWKFTFFQNIPGCGPCSSSPSLEPVNSNSIPKFSRKRSMTQLQSGKRSPPIFNLGNCSLLSGGNQDSGVTQGASSVEFMKGIGLTQVLADVDLNGSLECPPKRCPIHVDKDPLLSPILQVPKFSFDEDTSDLDNSTCSFI